MPFQVQQSGGGKGSSGASAPAESSNTGRADHYVPMFSGKQAEYREFRRRCDLYEAKIRVAGREKETVFNIVTLLTGRAWDLIEDLSVDDLKKENAYARVCSRLGAAFKLGQPLWSFLCEASEETWTDAAGLCPRLPVRGEEAKVISQHWLASAWWCLWGSGVTKEQRHLVAWLLTKLWRRWTSSWVRARSKKDLQGGAVVRPSTRLRPTMLVTRLTGIGILGGRVWCKLWGFRKLIMERGGWYLPCRRRCPGLWHRRVWWGVQCLRWWSRWRRKRMCAQVWR